MGQNGIASHPSETNQENIKADVNLKSISIEQLRNYAQRVVQDPQYLSESAYAIV